MDSRARRILHALQPTAKHVPSDNVVQKCEGQIGKENSVRVPARFDQIKKCALLDGSWDGSLSIDDGQVWKPQIFEHTSFIYVVTHENIDMIKEKLHIRDSTPTASLNGYEMQGDCSHTLIDKSSSKEFENDNVTNQLNDNSALRVFYSAASSLLQIGDYGENVCLNNNLFTGTAWKSQSNRRPLVDYSDSSSIDSSCDDAVLCDKPVSLNIITVHDSNNDKNLGDCTADIARVEENLEIPMTLESCSMIDSDDTDNDPNFEKNLSDYIESPSTEEFEDLGVRRREKLVERKDSKDSEASEEEEERQKKRRKRKANRSVWKESVVKKRRNQGKSYQSRKTNKHVIKRKVRSGCSSCHLECTQKIDDHQRFRLFQRFWGLGDLTKQRQFIAHSIQEITPRYRYTTENSCRRKNLAFYFVVDGKNRRVCRKFFIATLDISVKMIRTARDKLKEGIMLDDLRGKHTKHKQLPEAIKQGVRDHINKIPRIPSHYLRAQTEREYIEGGRTIAQIYRDYVVSCREEGITPAGRTVFFEIFNEFNISFFVPKKDLCELCVAYENSVNKIEREEEYKTHLVEKNLAREEKDRDKNNTDGSIILATYDLQAALPTPRGEVSTFYYRSKLSTYNLTIYNIKECVAKCNVWHEGDGNRGAIEIATSVFKFIEEQVINSEGKDIEFIFYTDNCCGQQKNKFIVMMYMYALCVFPNIKRIFHKFLIKGHTQNEGDAVHSLIEKEIKRALKCGPIYVPSQYYQLMHSAKKNPPFHEINELHYNDFIDFKELSNLIGGNFNVNEKRVTFHFGDIKIIKLCQKNPFIFSYKTSYQANVFETVDTSQSKIQMKRNTRTSITPTDEERRTNLINWSMKKAYKSRIPLADNKKRDLNYLLDHEYIKPVYADFYKSILK